MLSSRSTNQNVNEPAAPMRTLHANVIQEIEPFVESQLSLLKPVAENWQPADFLPTFETEGWRDEIRQLHERTQRLSDELLVALVGNLITEEALPTYQTLLSQLEGLADQTGVSSNPWAQWIRGWTAEENRHGELLSKYLYLSGRVNGRAVDVTIQHLLRNGFDPQTDNDPYRGLIYTAFQERATRISHGNVAQFAAKSGDLVLEKICQMISGDEARHEEAYKRFVRKIFEVDAAGAVTAFAQMMRVRITMPGCLMSDGSSHDIFGQFSSAAQRIGVYTIHDYANIIDYLVAYWGVADMTGLFGPAADAQEYLCGLTNVYRRAADRMDAHGRSSPQIPCSWVFNRPI